MTLQTNLNTPVQYLKGVGPALGGRLLNLNIRTVGDLLWLLPHRYADRRVIAPISELTAGKDRVVKGRVVERGISFMGGRKKRIYQVFIQDESGQKVAGKWFYFKVKWMEEKFPLGKEILFSGEVSQFGKTMQFIHPEVESVQDDESVGSGKILPFYPLTEGVHQRTVRKLVAKAWELTHRELKEVLPEDFLQKHQLLKRQQSLFQLHFPDQELPVAQVQLLNDGVSPAQRSLIFDEFFFLQLGVLLRKRDGELEAGIAFDVQAALHEKFCAALPFQLTNAQQRVIAQIHADMQKPQPMNRLVQGDVGSGKTVVALAAALQALQNGHQVALMAPTEILAEQHASNMRALLAPFQIQVFLLTGSTKTDERKRIHELLHKGETILLVGTHALIQGDVHFAKLGLIVVDEQHRFGVLQRQALRQKGLHPDLLIMTATPIPRTLALTLYGDLEVSLLDEMPAGRKPILTKLYREAQREKLFQGMRHELKAGRQVYVICPLVEESEKIDLKNATDTAAELQQVFAPEFKVALLHGRMKSEEKDAVMQSFKRGEVQLLVSTSVVEVGVDVPNATVMVIEHAERFGLSQLHQLRGRVGRGQHQSYCILVSGYQSSEESVQRLDVMVATNDGFKIAEEDLKIRGPGEFLGTRQSGLPTFHLANLVRDVDILCDAREAAKLLLEKDPSLALAEHAKLKEELQLRWAGRLELAKVS